MKVHTRHGIIAYLILICMLVSCFFPVTQTMALEGTQLVQDHIPVKDEISSEGTDVSVLIENYTLNESVPNEVYFYPTDDSFVWDSSAGKTTNYGKETYLYIKRDASGYNRKIYIKFDIGDYDGEYVQAVIRLYANTIQNAPSRTITVYATEEAWEENTITWNNVPAKKEKVTSLEIANTTGAPDRSGHWFDFDVTAYMKQNPEKRIVSFLLENEGSISNASDVQFNSKEAGDKWPELILSPREGTQEEIEITTWPGEAPVLPQTVKINYNDRTTEEFPVAWDNIAPETYATPGLFDVYGRIEGTELQAVAHIRVIGTEKMDVWTVSSYENVFKDTIKQVSAASAIDWVVARNEFESAQVLLRCDYDFTIEDITFNDLISGDNKIDKANLNYQFLEYVYLPSNTSSLTSASAVRFGPGYYPDPLSNETSIDVTKDTTQSIWMTLYVPKDSKAGTYTGKANIATSLGKFSVDISAEVNDVTIPDSSEANYKQVMWQLMIGSGFGETYPDSHPDETIVKHYGYERWTPGWWDLIGDIAHQMKDHRLNMLFVQTVQLLLDGGTTVDRGGNYSFNWSKFDEYIEFFMSKGVVKGLTGYMFTSAGSRVNLIKLDSAGRSMTGSELMNTPAAENWFKQYIPALYSHLQEKGWLDIWFQNLRDEPGTVTDRDDYAKLMELVETFAPDMKVGDPHVTAEAGEFLVNTVGVDVFIPILNLYNGYKELYNNALTEGKELYTYTCVGPGGTYLNRFIDKPVWQGRSIAWYNYNMGATGYLHWGLMGWYRPITDFANGDTATIYPDVANNKVKSSIRFEALRDGAEDYELLKIVEKLNPGIAKDLANKIAKDGNSSYSTSIEEMLTIRTMLVRAAAGNLAVIPQISGLSLDNSNLSLEIGGYSRLTATVNPPDAINTDITWESSNSNIVRVNERGQVFAVSAGTAAITATSVANSGITAKCDVVVNYVPERTTYYPAADSYVRDGDYSNSNYGNDNIIVVKSDNTGYARKGYVKFDTSSYDGVFTKATFKIYASSVNFTPSRTIDIYMTDENWAESTITWRNAPAKGEKIASITITNNTGLEDKTGYWYEFDVTNYLKENPNNKVISFLLINEGAKANATEVLFNTREAEVNWPMLVIDHTGTLP